MLTVGAACGLLATPGRAAAPLALMPEASVPVVFAGQNTLAVTFRNPGPAPFATNLGWRLFQTSSATLAPVAPAQAGKPLPVLPGQTVRETVTVDFPEVRAESLFQIQWTAAGQELGRTTVRVLPGNLLAELTILTAGKPVGVLDPENRLKPLLQRQGVRFDDLEKADASAHWQQPLVLIGPFASTNRVPIDLKTRLEAQSARPQAIVWLQPPRPWAAETLPVYWVQHLAGRIAVVQAEAVIDIERNPQSQLNLLQYARRTLHPESFTLPATFSRL